MKRTAIAGAALVLMTASWVFAADVERFPADITWAARVDVQGMMRSDWGPKIREGCTRPQAARLVNAAKALFGIDLLNDIHALAICGRQQLKQSVVIYVRGNLDAERLVAWAALANGYTVSAYGSFEIHSWNDKNSGGKGYGCFVTPQLLVFANNEARMRAAIDAIQGTGAVARADLVDALAADGDFASAVALGVNTMPAVQAQTAVLEHVTDIQASLGAVDDMLRLSFAAVAEDAATASQIHAVLSGLRGLVLLDGGRRPAGAAVAERAVVRTDGLKVTLTITATEDELRQIELEKKGRGNRPARW